MQEPVLTVADLLARGAEATGLPLEVVGGAAGLARTIGSPYVQKTGLALAGFHGYLKPGRVLVFGESEIRFLEALPPAQRDTAVDTALASEIPCLLVTGGWDVDEALRRAADRHAVPVLRTPVSTPMAITRLSAVLEDALAVNELLHGVLVDIAGLGVLLMGESGIGKSECALDLVMRGHRLVADDSVLVRRRGDSVLGTSPELTRHHMEIRGLGILNVSDLFGAASTRDVKRVELVVRLERWDVEREYDRLGLDQHVHDLCGIKVPLIHMPVAPGRNLATLVEVAARNQLLRIRGIDSARHLVTRIDTRVQDDGADSQDAAAGERP